MFKKTIQTHLVNCFDGWVVNLSKFHLHVNYRVRICSITLLYLLAVIMNYRRRTSRILHYAGANLENPRKDFTLLRNF